MAVGKWVESPSVQTATQRTLSPESGLGLPVEGVASWSSLDPLLETLKMAGSATL
jgi:hypothetical protein